MDNVDGFLVEEGNYLELANKILVLINNTDLRIRMGNEALKESRFDLEVIVREWKKILQ